VIVTRVIGFNYTLRDVHGQVLDASGGDPLFFLEGAGQIIPGLEEAVVLMQVGEQREVRVRAADAYGEHNPEYVVAVERSQLPPGSRPEVGDQFTLSGDQPGPVFTVVEVSGGRVIVDGNHPLAGKELVFAVDVVEIRDARAEEEAAGFAFRPG
jgi:FKBP-type peptidyl-prolyl cis-trans isomerase SlyD